MKCRQNLLVCAVAAAFALPFTAVAENTLHQYPQASGNTSRIAPEGTHFPAPPQQTQQQTQQKQAQQKEAQQQQAQQGQRPDFVVITIAPVNPPMSDRQRRESTFRAIDTNGDGEISMSEAGVDTQLLQAFQNLDSNSNRSIDRQEFTRVHVDDGSQQASAQAQQPQQGQSAAAGASLPSRSIEERSKFSIPGESSGR